MVCCDFCRKSTEGRYWQYANGKKICDSCRATLPSCDACGIATQKALVQNGRRFCEDCARKGKKCHFCRGILLGRYIRCGGKDVCFSCYRTLPRCALCSSPMNECLEIAEGKKLCLPCSRKVEHCATCQIPLLGTFYRFPPDPRKFCKSCSSRKNRCDICSLPLTPIYHAMRDGRLFCEKCMAEAVKNPKKAEEMLREVLEYLENEFGMRVRKTARLQIVDARTLARVRKTSRLFGDKDRRSLGVFVRKGENFEVYVESHLPRPICLAVLAHEYTHAWQADTFPRKAGILWVEGLAEWIAYHTLLRWEYKTQAEQIPRQQDEYGQGFRKVQALEKKYGISRVIDKVLKITGRGKK